MHADDDAGQLFVAKWNQNAGADGGDGLADSVSKDAVERDRYGYIAEGRHFPFGGYQKPF